jgi:hypothetical protein
MDSDRNRFMECNVIVVIHELGTYSVIKVQQYGVAQDFIMLGENSSGYICLHSAFNRVENMFPINVHSSGSISLMEFV